MTEAGGYDGGMRGGSGSPDMSAPLFDEEGGETEEDEEGFDQETDMDNEETIPDGIENGQKQETKNK